MIHKSNVALAILQSTMFVLQSTLFTVGVLHIEAMFNFLLYTKSIVALLIPLLIIV